jgi:hypothetical protein
MIKKLFLILIVGMLVFSGVQAVTIKQGESETRNIKEKVTFTDSLIIEEKEDYLSVDVEKTDVKIDETGKPMLPVYLKTYTFSRNVKIKEISCEFSNIKEKRISAKVIPAPELIPYSLNNNVDADPIYTEDAGVYESDALYPENWYDYSIRCGLNSDEVPTTFVIVELYPVRYSPKQNMLYYMNDFTIDISFNDPGYQKNLKGETYDLVIIAPNAFKEKLQSLVSHKNSNGMSTLLKTTEEIYSSYSGRDDPEKIKYFIKDAKETYDFTYLLLVGGLKSYLYAVDRDDINHGSSGWHVPVRYANIKHSDEKSCISDLYYGDIYKYNETSQEWEFEDWDSNGDGIFARVSGLGSQKDDLDLVPDVYYGRLACRNKIELGIVIRKIKNYEKTSPESKSWFRKMIGIGGQTFEIYEGIPDGEWACNKAMEYMDDLIDVEVKVYGSHEGTSLPKIPEDVIPEINKGAGYVFFQGHGNPVAWNTHPADTTDVWLGATTIFQFHKFRNLRKLPVVVVGGCHNALFNVSMIQILLNRKDNPHNYWSWDPTWTCFSWAFCVNPLGGAIACTGCTGYGFGSPETYSGALEGGFFHEIGNGNATHLGEAHSGSIRDYFTENKVSANTAFAATIWQMFGDPSLRLGGYP